MVLLYALQHAGHGANLPGQFTQLFAVLVGLLERLQDLFPCRLPGFSFYRRETIFGQVSVLIIPGLGKSCKMVEELFPSGLFKYGCVGYDKFFLEGVLQVGTDIIVYLY